MKKKVILVVRDGWGFRKSHYMNAIAHSDTPNTDYLMKHYPNSLLKASGEAVGLPKDFQGNSEVGHMTMGAGRVILQSLSRINESIKDGSFFRNSALLGAIKNCKKHSSALHIMGLLQSEGVHSYIGHLYALLDLCRKNNFHNIFLHVFTDGRDAPVHDGIKYIKRLQKKLKGIGKIASVSGRYYAMDRDNRWPRTRKAYDAITAKTNITFSDPVKFVKQSYKNGITDEFLIPGKLKDYCGVKPHDAMIFFNYRTDRPRQLTKALIEKKFAGWKRSPLDVYFVAMTQYYIPMNAHVAFKDIRLKNILGEVISREGLRQLRISETEKYAHVTFFFNDQREKPFPSEDRILIPSPKVATYDLKPEMSVYKITDKLVEQIKKKKYDFIVTNMVNCDMVGHTGVWGAVLKAIFAVDDCLGRIVEAGINNDYAILICADHGNAEDMTRLWRTSHTTNPVPCILIDGSEIHGGSLADIAPTVLKLMGIRKPKEMSGRSLV